MSDPRGGSRRDPHIGEAFSAPESGGGRGDTRSDTGHSGETLREAMDWELMGLSVWLSENPKAMKKNLKPVRRAVILDPGVYYNAGIRMIERLYKPQHVALGHNMFHVNSDPAAPVEEIRRRVLEGKR